jgi:hypothetical protein
MRESAGMESTQFQPMNAIVKVGDGNFSQIDAIQLKMFINCKQSADSSKEDTGSLNDGHLLCMAELLILSGQQRKKGIQRK